VHIYQALNCCNFLFPWDDEGIGRLMCCGNEVHACHARQLRRPSALKSDMYDGVLTLLSASHKLPQRLSKPVAHDHTVVHENISHQVGNTVVAECHELGDRGR
jgi:hypothetical protein